MNTFILKRVVFVFILGLSSKYFNQQQYRLLRGFVLRYRFAPARSSPPSASGSRSAKKCY
jgi:hypothetical protein